MSNRDHLQGLINTASAASGVSQAPSTEREQAAEEFEAAGFDLDNEDVQKAIDLRGNELREE